MTLEETLQEIDGPFVAWLDVEDLKAILMAEYCRPVARLPDESAGIRTKHSFLRLASKDPFSPAVALVEIEDAFRKEHTCSQ